MTIEDLQIHHSSSPQDDPTNHHGGDNDNKDNKDIESLVRGLVEQARAAEERSAALAERVALLEGRGDDNFHDNNNSDDTAAAGGQATIASSSEHSDAIGHQSLITGRFGSTRVSFAEQPPSPPKDDNRMITSSTRSSSSSLQIVKGVPESNNNIYMNDDDDNDDNDPPEHISDRVTLLERRLQDYDEQKSIHNVLFDERNKYALPESTFSLLVTHNPLTVPFVFAAFSVALSISCLSLTLASSISNGRRGNRLGVPAGVDGMVQAAQFLGAIVGVLMEDEIPQGLQLIANGAGHTLLLNGDKPVHKRVIVSSIFRLIVGYLFLSSLFITIAQSSDVIEIFYDVLALEFVENIDDTAYALAKRGFFGRSMLLATNQSYSLKVDTTGLRRSVIFGPSDRNAPSSRSLTERRLSFSGLIASNNRVNHLVRTIYFLNAAMILAGLSYFATKQNAGTYRCGKISVLFDEEIWENAHVRLPDGTVEDRLLIYSYFNGKYEENGTFDGYPRYVEMNKNDGSPFGPSVEGAEILYCHEIGSWVFRHSNIWTSPDGKEENECSWLWRSSSTEDFDILSTSDGAWEAWVGEVKQLVQVSITCNECSERPDCNYHGHCIDKVCECEDTYFGDSCQFEKACPSLATEKASSYDPVDGLQWKQETPIRAEVGLEVYNRPVYIQKGLSGEPFDMRLYKILEKEKTPSPSSQPSNIPSVTVVPTPMPSVLRSGSGEPISEASVTDFDGPPPIEPYESPPWPTSFPTVPPPLHAQNEYDTAPDFADWDDFFESPHMHDLNDIMEDYSVVISFIGTRFYGTMVEPDVELHDLFPQDYHAFWSQAFDINRTFIISDTTFASSPVGVDFYEMRRRIVNSIHDENIQFSYGPFGALIPLMSYEATGFFHCLHEIEAPSISPSSSGVPTFAPSTSMSPTACYDVDITIQYDGNPDQNSWTLEMVANANGEYFEEGETIDRSGPDFKNPYDVEQYTKCLPEGVYKFTMFDSNWDGLCNNGRSGFYTLRSEGEQIKYGGKFRDQEITEFSIPVGYEVPSRETVPPMASPSIVTPRPLPPDYSVEVQNEDVTIYIDPSPSDNLNQVQPTEDPGEEPIGEVAGDGLSS